MSPYEQAVAMYDGEDVGKIIAYCAVHGVVSADSEGFLCAYPTHSSLIETESKYANEIKSKKELDKPDTWCVLIGVGNKNLLMSLVEPMEFVAYERFDKKFRLIPWRKLWAV